MASTCCRFISRTTTSAFRSASRSAPRVSPFPSSSKANSSPLRSSCLSRTPSELGGMQSLLPLHSAVSLARMTSHLSTSSRSCRSLTQECVDENEHLGDTRAYISPDDIDGT